MDEQKPLQDRDPGPQLGDVPTPPAGPVPGRRRLLTGGLSASGVVLTLASRPVLGWQCKSPSAAGSVTHASHHAGVEGTTSSLTARDWLAKDKSEWPSGYADTKFKSIFSLANTNRTLFQVLHDGTSAYNKYFVVAVLNMAMGFIPTTCLNLDQLKKMWADARPGQSGYYSPVPGVKWYAEDVLNYLRNNGIAP